MEKWSRTQYANLRRYISSGMYHAYAKVRGRKIRLSLKTKSLEIAKLKLDKLLAEERAKVPVCDEDWTMKPIIDLYLSEIEANYMLEPRSKDYRKETALIVRNTWPGLDDMNPRKLTKEQVIKWSQRLKEKYSPSRFNGVVESFRGILRLGMERGIVNENLGLTIKRVRVPIKPPELPTSAQFQSLLKALDSVPHRKYAARFVRLMAYTGMRIASVPKVFRRNFDMERKEFILPPLKKQKTEVRIPMIQELQDLAQELLVEHTGTGPIFTIKSPRKALIQACKDVGIAPVTPHGLRHTFATRCLESGVDVRTVAAWLCHRDGGSLLLKRYAHLRNDHARKMADLVKF